MSHYDWERGSLKLSTKEFTKFRQELVAAYNKALDKDFDVLLTAFALVKQAGKGKRKFDFKLALEAELNKTASTGFWGGRAPMYDFKLIDNDDAMRLLIVDAKMVTLKRKDFPKATVGAKHDVFPPPGCPAYSGEGSIRLKPASKEVCWSVSENNHACERARESFFGRFFFQYMNKVTWTRDTGGTIAGNDEYNQESQDAGDGSNYIKEAYGPRGTAEKEAQYGYPTRRRTRR